MDWVVLYFIKKKKKISSMYGAKTVFPKQIHIKILLSDFLSTALLWI